MTKTSDLSKQEKLELIELLEEKNKRIEENFIDTLFPEEGLLSRFAYSKHMLFFDAGNTYSQRAMLAANQIGKSLAIAYELVCHLTGIYPEWWTGKVFTGPINAWAAGYKSNLKEAIQDYIIGDINNPGAGLVRKSIMDKARVTRKAGVTDVAQDIYIPHLTGGRSRLTLKSYDEEAKAFQGARLDFIWLDEEPKNYKIYTECLTRLVAKQGIMACSFTPLDGLSEVVLSFLDAGRIPGNGVGVHNGKYTVNVTWDDAPHLSEERKKELLESYPIHERDARSKGIPALGSGAIYPISEDYIKVDPFEIPAHWPKVYGFDVGWNKTAAVWGAWDRETDTTYLYSEHYMGEEKPVVHAEAIKSRGAWIPGVIDPASGGRSQIDGSRLLELYYEQGLEIAKADNSVEAGILNVLNRLSTGRIKVFSNLSNWLTEFRIYRRNDKGKIIKSHDHLMDATRYLFQSGLEFAITEPASMDDEDNSYGFHDSGANNITGY